MIGRKFTHTTKGGLYEVVGASSGQGSMKSCPLMVYRCCLTGRLHHREPEAFSRRMRAVSEDAAVKILAEKSGKVVK
jgi:hypothetical protein